MDVSVVAPEAVRLRCQVAGQPVPQIVWIREFSTGTVTEFTMSTDNINITETIDGLNKTSVLIIQPTSALDTARFRCRAQNQLSVSTTIVVYSIEVQINIYGT